MQMKSGFPLLHTFLLSPERYLGMPDKRYTVTVNEPAVRSTIDTLSFPSAPVDIAVVLYHTTIELKGKFPPEHSPQTQGYDTLNVVERSPDTPLSDTLAQRVAGIPILQHHPLATGDVARSAWDRLEKEYFSRAYPASTQELSVMLLEFTNRTPSAAAPRPRIPDYIKEQILFHE